MWMSVCGFCKEFLTNKNRNCQGLSEFLTLGWKESGLQWEVAL